MEETVKKKLYQLDEHETAGLEQRLDIALNTRIMLRVNDQRTAGMVNGARGTVKDIVYDATGKTVSKIMVKFDNIEEVQCIERVRRMIMVAPRCFVYRKMFPLINAYAMTIHKSQSLSLECVFADLGNEIFAAGMSYVALSRCTSHKGLYLMNFNPKKVRASKNACIEYSRLLNLLDGLEDKGVAFNKGVQSEGLERTWYTTYAQRFATRATASDIKAEKRKRKAAAPTDCPANKKSKVNDAAGAKKSSGPNPTTGAKKSNGADSSTGAKKRRNVNASKKDASNKKHKTSHPTKGPQRDDVIVTGVVNRPYLIDYCPVGEEWQRNVCNAFGWDFREPSFTGAERRDISHLRKPRPSTRITGDGHCWYRSIAHIVTGDQEDFRLIKNAVLNYMRQNVDFLQEIFLHTPHFIPIDSRIGYSDTAAARFIEYHANEDPAGRYAPPWADNVIIEFTSCLLKSRCYSYTVRGGWLSTNRIAAFSGNRADFLVSTVELQPSQKSIYIDYKNGNHFQPAHNGLIPQRTGSR